MLVIERRHVIRFGHAFSARCNSHFHEVIIAVFAAEPHSRIMVAFAVGAGVVIVLAWQSVVEVWREEKARLFDEESL